VPNQIFFEMVERGKGKVRPRIIGVQAAFEGLSRLSSKIVIHFHLDILVLCPINEWH